MNRKLDGKNFMMRDEKPLHLTIELESASESNPFTDQKFRENSLILVHKGTFAEIGDLSASCRPD
jgi:hypothetical protein